MVTVALSGEYGKPRPAVVVQADLFNEEHASLTVLPLTSHIVDAPLFRITIDPSAQNGLRRVSQVMVDKIVTAGRARVGDRLGTISEQTMVRITRALAVWLGIA